MKTIVTGGAGFIGSHLVDLLLEEGHQVTVLDNFSTGRPDNLSHVVDQIQLIECDLATQGAWQKEFEEVDWVFHLAALADIVPSIQQPQAYFQSNVNGTFNVLQASQKGGIKRFVYAASSSCYGIPDQYPTPETAPICPQYPYALTKRLGEELVLHWAQVYELPALSLRFFNVYGPRSRKVQRGRRAAVSGKERVSVASVCRTGGKSSFANGDAGSCATASSYSPPAYRPQRRASCQRSRCPTDSGRSSPSISKA